jgi:hypothetical protein
MKRTALDGRVERRYYIDIGYIIYTRNSGVLLLSRLDIALAPLVAFPRRALRASILSQHRREPLHGLIYTSPADSRYWLRKTVRALSCNHTLPELARLTMIFH